MILAYIFIHIENILIVALSSTIKLPDAKNMDVLKPIALWCHAGGTVVSFIFFLWMMCRKDIMSLELEIPCCECQLRIVNLNVQSRTQAFELSDNETVVIKICCFLIMID